MARPRALKRGDTIGIAAPASPFDRNLFMKGVKALESMGFAVLYRKDIFDQNRYFAGTEKRRAKEFTELMADERVGAVMFARGGYGSQRVIPMLDPEELSKRPKPVIGFSDITALLTFLRQRSDVPTFYGPVVTQLGRGASEATREWLLRSLTVGGALGAVEAKGAATLKAGKARGRLAGGCLTLINSSIGTPYELDTEGAVLFIEDVGEKVYALDRMLVQLKAVGAIDRCRGMIVGNIEPPKGETYDVESMLRDVLADFEGPVVHKFPAGHSEDFITLPLGATVEIHAEDAGSPPAIEFTEGLLE